MINQIKLREVLLPKLLVEGELYYKFKPVLAKRATSPQQVITVTASGIETVNEAQVGDYIVENITSAKEQYVLKPKKFKQLYKKSGQKKAGKGIYLPRGKVHAILVDEEICTLLEEGEKFEILAPWGQPQIIRKGDYLVSPPGYQEFYGIGGKEFKETYRNKKNKKVDE